MRDYIKIRVDVAEVRDAEYDAFAAQGWDDAEMLWDDVQNIVGDAETAQQVWDYLIGVGHERESLPPGDSDA